MAGMVETGQAVGYGSCLVVTALAQLDRAPASNPEVGGSSPSERATIEESAMSPKETGLKERRRCRWGERRADDIAGPVSAPQARRVVSL